MRQTLSSVRGAQTSARLTLRISMVVTFLVTFVMASALATPVQAAPAPATTPTVGQLVHVQQGAVLNHKIKKKKPLARRALAKARTRAGKPYRYGATGPNAFDCSGLTSWAYKKAGKKLPRTSGAQARAAKRVKKPRPGDLVFFHNGGSVYHVGLYAGKGKVFHASRPGVPVGKAKIWTSSVFYGRV